MSVESCGKLSNRVEHYFAGRTTTLGYMNTSNHQTRTRTCSLGRKTKQGPKRAQSAKGCTGHVWSCGTTEGSCQVKDLHALSAGTAEDMFSVHSMHICLCTDTRHNKSAVTLRTINSSFPAVAQCLTSHSLSPSLVFDFTHSIPFEVK